MLISEMHQEDCFSQEIYEYFGCEYDGQCMPISGNSAWKTNVGRCNDQSTELGCSYKLSEFDSI